MGANTRHKGTVMMQCSKTGWEVTTRIVAAEREEQKMISTNRFQKPIHVQHNITLPNKMHTS
eukprot:5314778-Ditylum_brightwellii.AAC.1